MLLLPTAIASAIISTTITIDADLADWAGVRADPGNTARDTQISDPDPDYPGQPDRDTYLVNATWDPEYLYLAYRRTSGGTKAVTWGAYIDLDGDGLLQNSDVVAWWTTGQSTSSRHADAHAPSPTAGIFNYNQAIIGKGGPLLHPGGDPMGHDGETPDGWANVQSGQIVPAAPMDGWLATNGIEFEGKIAWSDLGVPAGSPISIHFVNANGESFGVKWTPSDTRKWIGNPPQYVEENRGQVEDNVDGIWWLRYRDVDLTPDNAGGDEPGKTVEYTHTIANLSNDADTFDLSALSSAGWLVEITDAGGVAIDAVSLAAGATTTVKVRVTIPAGTPDGTRDTTVLTATSQTDATVNDAATDTTTAGRITITPEHAGSMAPGQTITYPFTVNNNMPSAGRFDLTGLSTLGWVYQITDLAGNPISYVDLSAGGSADVLVKVTVPAGATVGMQDVTRLTATLQGQPSIKATSQATTNVLGPLTITPNNTGFTGSNTIIDYDHTITNSWPTTRTIDLTATSSRGWNVRFFAADGVTQITSVVVGPNGSTADVIARITVPAGTGTGVVDTTTVRASTGGTTVTATDITTVRALTTYADAGYTVYSNDFTLTDPVFARATGLSAGSKVYFEWYDTNGTLVRTSPERTVDTMGMAFDDVTTTASQPTGGWRVELHSSAGTLLETSTFTERWKAEITALSATDAPQLASDVAVTSSVRNQINAPIANSTMTYVIWWDDNGDGTFNAGDTYIDSTGQPHVWDGVTVITTHVTSGIDVASSGTWTEPAPWTVNNRDFPHQGNYNVTATWRDSAGGVIDVATTQFYSIPALGWPLAGLLALAGLTYLVRRRELLVPVHLRSHGGEAA